MAGKRLYWFELKKTPQEMLSRSTFSHIKRSTLPTVCTKLMLQQFQLSHKSKDRLLSVKEITIYQAMRTTALSSYCV